MIRETDPQLPSPTFVAVYVSYRITFPAEIA